MVSNKGNEPGTALGVQLDKKQLPPRAFCNAAYSGLTLDVAWKDDYFVDQGLLASVPSYTVQLGPLGFRLC